MVDHALHLAVSMEQISGVDPRVSTNERDAQDVAIELRGTLHSYGLTA